MYDTQNPILYSSSINHLESNTWSSCTPKPNSVGGITERGLTAFKIHCDILDCLNSHGNYFSINKVKYEGIGPLKPLISSFDG